MNWTGGRLYRHSSNNNNNNRVGSLTTKQKRHFASIKRNTCNTNRRWPSPSPFLPFQAFEGVSDSSIKRGTQTQNQASFSFIFPKPCHNHTDDTEKTKDHVSFADSDRANRVTHLHGMHDDATDPRTMKEQLFKKLDGAAVSAVRPLKMKFTTVDELERFGKRRKLTHADHKRLASTGGRPFQSILSTLPQRRPVRRSPSEVEMVKGMDICINTHVPKQTPIDTMESPTHPWSSQTMLLDSEDGAADGAASEGRLSATERPGSKATCISDMTRNEAIASTPSLAQTLNLLRPPVSTLDGSDCSGRECIGGSRVLHYTNSSTNDAPDPESTRSPLLQEKSPSQRLSIDDQAALEKESILAVDSDGFLSTGQEKSISPLSDSHVGEIARPGSRQSSLLQVNFPSQRRFTIDDQAVLEKEGIFAVDSRQDKSEHSTNLLSQKRNAGQIAPTVHISVDDRFPSNKEPSTWLPVHSDHVQRWEPQADSPFARYRESSASLLPNDSQMGSAIMRSTPPAKIYGQDIASQNEVIGKSQLQGEIEDDPTTLLMHSRAEFGNRAREEDEHSPSLTYVRDNLFPSDEVEQSSPFLPFRTPGLVRGGDLSVLF